MRDYDKEREDWNRKQRALVEAGKGVHRNNIIHLCCQHELESDEFYTREQKAERMLLNLT